MRAYSMLLCFLLATSSGASGFILGRNSPARRATDIPTRLETIDAMADEMGLDGAQRMQVIAISDRHHDALQAVRGRVAADLDAIRSAVRAETRAIMNDQQKRRFDNYCARRDAQRTLADR